MDPLSVRVHEHLLALVVRAGGGWVPPRHSYGLAGAGVGACLSAGRVVYRAAKGRVELVATGPVGDPLMDAVEDAWPFVAGVAGRPTALATWVRRATMITGQRAAALAGERLCAAGVLARETVSGGIASSLRDGVRYREIEPAVVDELVSAARSIGSEDGSVSSSLALVVGGAESLRILQPLGIPEPAVQGHDPPWGNLVARSLSYASVEFGIS